MTLDLKAARVNMVENQVRTNDVTDLPIQDAMRVIRRERLCAPGKAYLAYAESTVDYAPGWPLLEARDIAKLLQVIYPLPGETAIAIAAPYAAAVLAWMGLEVTLHLPAAADAAAIRAALADPRIVVVQGPLDPIASGTPAAVVICEGAVTKTPTSWLDAVAAGGRLGVIERAGPGGKAKLYTRGADGDISGREVFDASPPVLPGFGPTPAFSF